MDRKKEVLITIIFVISMIMGVFIIKTLKGDDKIILAENDNPKSSEEYNLIQEDMEIREVVEEEQFKVKEIVVDICGAVHNPSVIVLDEGSRVIDAVKMAGGLTDKADIKRINLARKLVDGEKIIIPEIGEDLSDLPVETITPSYETGSKEGNKININTATKEELKRLNGIGDVLAEKIIEYREKSGGFKNINDIKNVNGIGEKRFEAIKDDITI